MIATFDRNSWAFLDRIAHDNTKETFDALRGTYHDHVAAPSTTEHNRLDEETRTHGPRDDDHRRTQPGKRDEAYAMFEKHLAPRATAEEDSNS